MDEKPGVCWSRDFLSWDQTSANLGNDRQQIHQHSGWLERRAERPSSSELGRPHAVYSLADHDLRMLAVAGVAPVCPGSVLPTDRNAGLPCRHYPRRDAVETA